MEEKGGGVYSLFDSKLRREYLLMLWTHLFQTVSWLSLNAWT